MGLHQFQQFYLVMQLYQVLHHGTFLANRWAPETSVSLYYYAGNGRSFLAGEHTNGPVGAVGFEVGHHLLGR